MHEFEKMDRRARGQLLRVLGVGFGLAVIVGNTIGAGILHTPGDVARQLPNVWLFLGVWVLGATYALLGANAVAELGTMLPRSGGQYVFARRALGDYAGFVVGWSDWLSTCGTTAAVSFVIGDYAGALLPALAGKTVPVAVLVTVVFALIQWRGIRWGGAVQNATSLLKCLAFVALVAACFIFGGGVRANAASTTAATAHGLTFVFALVLALQAVIYTYDGWAGVVYFSEEVEDPARDIPRALFGGVLLVMAIYLLVNLALLYVLPLATIAGQDLAVGVAAQAIFGAGGERVIRALTIVSMLSGLNAYHLMATRVLYAMSRDRLFSERAVRVNAGGTPTVALFVSCAVAVAFIVLGGAFAKIIAALAFFFVAIYMMTFASLFVLRWREPQTPRPFRAWGYPWTTGLALVGSVVFLFGAVAADLAGETRDSLYALGLLAASYPAYRLIKLIERPR
ncbi:MAG: basic amino acid/polyamine antiporter, family [Acidobacteriota bacterium]|nr:basic amino acid/polyamine antiporter, family [Acidobacteriota bacterium]